jgi:hypothetical protein
LHEQVLAVNSADKKAHFIVIPDLGPFDSGSGLSIHRCVVVQVGFVLFGGPVTEPAAKRRLNVTVGVQMEVLSRNSWSTLLGRCLIETYKRDFTHLQLRRSVHQAI